MSLPETRKWEPEANKDKLVKLEQLASLNLNWHKSAAWLHVR